MLAEPRLNAPPATMGQGAQGDLQFPPTPGTTILIKNSQKQTPPARKASSDNEGEHG